MLDELKTANKVVGIKQLRKAIAAGKVKKVFLAADADPMLTEPVAEQCRARDIAVISVPTMRQLGAACSISVDAAAAAIL
ncbi:MAG: ribosomal L7Ae/L30e/S12e/Gadd45 family protein [Oscillospiraceae bacterium]|nr:ribosomal L7Ae/L30e/S12e/Gadd45 family protein [Oscillospiraceae bacterium]